MRREVFERFMKIFMNFPHFLFNEKPKLVQELLESGAAAGGGRFFVK